MRRDWWLVTYSLEKKGWSVEELFATNLAQSDAEAMIREDGDRQD